MPVPDSAVRGLPRRWYAAAVAAPMLLVAVLGVARPAAVVDASNFVFDEYQRMRPRAFNPEVPVRVLDIDDESLRRLGQWPWPRTRIAEIFKRLGELGAAGVGVDIVFAEADATSPERLKPHLPERWRFLLASEPGPEKTNDQALAVAMAAVPTALGAILTNGDATRYPAKRGIAFAGDDPRADLPHFSGAVLPLAALSDRAAGIGALNWLPDRDQVVRRVPLLLAAGEEIVPSLSAEMLSIAQGASTIVVRSANASGHSAFGAHSGVDGVKIGALEIPTGRQGDIRVRYSGSDPRRVLAVWKLIAGEIDRREIEGRLIVLGTSAGGLGDRRATPLDASQPGSEIHAEVLEQLLAGDVLLRPDWLPGCELFVSLLLALIVGLALLRIAPITVGLGVVAALAAAFAGSWAAFVSLGALADPVIPSLSIATTYLSCLAWLHRDEQRQRRYVREAFGRYVSPAVVARLAANPARLRLGGEARVITVLFCDVRGFTTMAERLDAQALARFMNEYLTAVTEAVLAQDGTVDKYIGDALMAFWNAPADDPQHAAHAARAALGMVAALERFNARRRDRDDAQPHSDVRFGIGLATGECSVGNFGSTQRFDYSALGDSVNLASRLEGATKYYGTDILASETTWQSVPDLAWLEVDYVRVKGRSDPTRVFTLAGDETMRASSEFSALAQVHGRMLAAYRAGDFPAAVADARKLQACAPQRLQGAYQAFVSRCALGASQTAGWVPVTALEKM